MIKLYQSLTLISNLRIQCNKFIKLQAWLLMTLLLAFVFKPAPAFSKKIVFLQFEDFDAEDLPRDPRGNRSEFLFPGETEPAKFEDSQMILELTERENKDKPPEEQMTRKQFADMVMDGVLEKLKEIYQEVWIDFTKTKPDEGEFVTIDFPGKVTTVAPPIFPRRGGVGRFLGLAPIDPGDQRWDEKGWVLIEEARHKFWRLEKNEQGELVSVDKVLTKEQIIALISKTAAHEIGHTLGLDHPDQDNHVFPLPEGEKPTSEGVIRSVIDPEKGNIMSSGAALSMLSFTEKNLKTLKMLVGERLPGPDKKFFTEDDVAKHPTTVMEMTGDGDDHGTNPSGISPSGINGEGLNLIFPSDVMQGDNEAPFTDTLLSNDTFDYFFDFGGPLDTVNDVLLTIGLFNLDPTKSPVKLFIDNMEVLDPFANVDLRADFADNPDLGAFFAHHIFLDESLLPNFIDGQVTLSLEVPEDQLLSVDYIVVKSQIQTSIPEPVSSFALLVFGTLGAGLKLKQSNIGY